MIWEIDGASGLVPAPEFPTHGQLQWKTEAAAQNPLFAPPDGGIHHITRRAPASAHHLTGGQGELGNPSSTALVSPARSPKEGATGDPLCSRSAYRHSLRIKPDTMRSVASLPRRLTGKRRLMVAQAMLLGGIQVSLGGQHPQAGQGRAGGQQQPGGGAPGSSESASAGRAPEPAGAARMDEAARWLPPLASGLFLEMSPRRREIRPLPPTSSSGVIGNGWIMHALAHSLERHHLGSRRAASDVTRAITNTTT